MVREISVPKHTRWRIVVEVRQGQSLTLAASEQVHAEDLDKHQAHHIAQSILESVLDGLGKKKTPSK